MMCVFKVRHENEEERRLYRTLASDVSGELCVEKDNFVTSGMYVQRWMLNSLDQLVCLSVADSL